MKFVSEQDIDALIVRIEKDKSLFESINNEMSHKYAMLKAYLLSESFDVLVETEKEYMWYLSIVLIQAVEEVEGAVQLQSIDYLHEVEEKNWSLFNDAKGKTFRDKLNVFFEGFAQEDLLAYIEDALIDPEEDVLTTEGRVPIFIGLKSILDFLIASHHS